MQNKIKEVLDKYYSANLFSDLTRLTIAKELTELFKVEMKSGVSRPSENTNKLSELTNKNIQNKVPVSDTKVNTKVKTKPVIDKKSGKKFKKPVEQKTKKPVEQKNSKIERPGLGRSLSKLSSKKHTRKVARKAPARK